MENDSITAYAYQSENGTKLYFDHMDPSVEEVKNTYRQITADRLMPPQIRIADLIARSPDHLDMTAEQDDAEPVEQTGDMDRQERKRRPDHPERALIRDGQIVIEPIER